MLLQIIDPYVEIEVIGIPADNCKQRTKTIIDNGKYELYYNWYTITLSLFISFHFIYLFASNSVVSNRQRGQEVRV